MSARRVAFVWGVVTMIVAVCGFVLGAFSVRQLAGGDTAATDARLAALRADFERTLSAMHEGQSLAMAGTSGVRAPMGGGLERAALVEEIKRELQTEMGLLPLQLLRDRRESFVELYAYDNQGGSSYGTAGYLGNGYFITVKHGVVALGQSNRGRVRQIESIKLMYKDQSLEARVVDAGNAEAEVDPGDWAILKVRRKVDLPPLTVDLDYRFDFANPIFRLGNDYSKGIILSTGHLGQRTPAGLVTCLTDGHPGVSGGGVLDQKGSLVGIPVGRMQGDYRFSFILPLTTEMFRKVPFVLGQAVQAAE